jgi:hypothetical protein
MMPRALVITFAVVLVAVIGAGVYLIALKRHVQHVAQPADTQPLAPTAPGSTQHMVLYEADDERGSIRRAEADIAVAADPSERARQVLHALMAAYVARPSAHELAPGADVRTVYLLPNHVAVIDTTPQFAEGHRSGVLVEMLTVASIVQTLGVNEPDVERVKILVDGKERESLAGHADLTCFYHVGQVAELVKQLQ